MPVLSKEDPESTYHETWVQLYQEEQTAGQTRMLSQSICQMAKQFSYITRYFGAHCCRGLHQEAAIARRRATVEDQLRFNTALNRCFFTVDMKSKTCPSKSCQEQGFNFGLRGFSYGGGMLEFLVYNQDDGYYLMTAFIDIVYKQSSDQTLEEAMSALRLQLFQIKKDFPQLTDVIICSDNCGNYHGYEQIPFVVLGNRDGWKVNSSGLGFEALALEPIIPPTSEPHTVCFISVT